MILWLTRSVSATEPTIMPPSRRSPGLTEGTKCHFFAWSIAGKDRPRPIKAPLTCMSFSSGRWMPS